MFQFGKRASKLYLSCLVSFLAIVLTDKSTSAILNASPEGCLTTEEIEIAIRFHYPYKEFQKVGIITPDNQV